MLLRNGSGLASDRLSSALWHNMCRCRHLPASTRCWCCLVLQRFSRLGHQRRRHSATAFVPPPVDMPRGKATAFLSLSAAGFCMFAMVGLLTSLAPPVLAERL